MAALVVPFQSPPLGARWRTRYDVRMPYRDLRESSTPSNEEDVEPYFPEPLVELDLDE